MWMTAEAVAEALVEVSGSDEDGLYSEQEEPATESEQDEPVKEDEAKENDWDHAMSHEVSWEKEMSLEKGMN